jgi:ribulose-5-phosphate 4-epimerase/fuculose-1-phosphate aldolase
MTAASTTATSAPAFTAGPEALLPPLDPRQELVLLARTLRHEGYEEHLSGHITIRLDDGTLLCNPWYLLWDEFGPDDVIRIDRDGDVVEGRWPAPPGITLHVELHKARDDVGVALHAHSRWGTVWADAHRVPPCLDQSSALGGGTIVVVDEYQGAVNHTDAAAAAVAAMGDADMALLAHHGVFVLGRSVRAVHQRAVALEHRCRTAWLATQLVDDPPALPDAVRQRFGRNGGESFVGFWEAMARRELRADPTLLAWHP